MILIIETNPKMSKPLPLIVDLLLKITVKRLVAMLNKVPTTDDERVDKSKKSTKEILKENSANP